MQQNSCLRYWLQNMKTPESCGPTAMWTLWFLRCVNFRNTKQAKHLAFFFFFPNFFIISTIVYIVYSKFNAF